MSIAYGFPNTESLRMLRKGLFNKKTAVARAAQRLLYQLNNHQITEHPKIRVLTDPLFDLERWYSSQFLLVDSTKNGVW